ncbi:hypothetical protein ACQP00_22905 [Dactylosporangium sp. CS-047395]
MSVQSSGNSSKRRGTDTARYPQLPEFWDFDDEHESSRRLPRLDSVLE